MHPAAPRASRRAWTVMLGLLVPLAVLTAVGLLALWPAGASEADAGGWDPAAAIDGSSRAVGTVTMVDLRQCPEAETYGCSAVTVEVDGTEGSLFVPPEAFAAKLAPGDSVKVMSMPDDASADPVAEALTGDSGSEGSGAEVSDGLRTSAPGDPASGNATGAPAAADYVFLDFDRTVSLSVLATVYAALVVLVAGLKGLRALIGLVFAFAVMVVFMLPALLDGSSAVLVGTTAASVIMFAVLYLAHGFSARTTSALLGTLLGIALTGILAAVWTDWAKLGGIYSEEAYILSWTDGLSTADLVICGILIAGLGVLNDVTITQAAAVWELAVARPGMRAAELFASAMRIGRDHIASTVYTIAFAFAGGALTVLLLVSSSSRPFIESLTLGELAIEVVSILVCSIGLVLAIPLTTLISVIVVRSGQAVSLTADGGRAPLGGRTVGRH
nr:YibE/F family protein [Brevibacterium daeguense]